MCVRELGKSCIFSTPLNNSTNNNNCAYLCACNCVLCDANVAQITVHTDLQREWVYDLRLTIDDLRQCLLLISHE